MKRPERRKSPRESLSPFGELGRAHGAGNSLAEETRSGHRRRIGVYCEGGDWIFYSPYFGRLLSGIAQGAELGGGRLVMYLPAAGRGSSGFNQVSRHELGYSGIEQLKDGLADAAIVLCGRALNPKQAALLKSLKIPVLLLSNNKKVRGFFQLSSGAYERALLCTEQLYIEGRKKVGMIGLYANSSYHDDSLRGMKAASKKCKKAFAPSQLHPLNQWDLAKPFELQNAIDTLMKQGCDAIICSEATQALVAHELLKKAKVQMPQKLSLVSFGPLPRSARAVNTSALRLLQVDLVDEGIRAYKLLEEAMQGKPARTETIRWSWPAY